MFGADHRLIDENNHIHLTFCDPKLEIYIPYTEYRLYDKLITLLTTE